MKVALVHDYLNQWGGAEQVLLALHEMFPEAPIYTLFYHGLEQEDKDVRDRPIDLSWVTDNLQTSGLQKLPAWLRSSRMMLPIYPTAVEMFDLSEYDLVISDSSAFSKGVLTRPETVHICYCHTPTRYLWDWHERYLQEQRMGWFKKSITVPILSLLRIWDFWAADRVDLFVANSKNVQERIAKFYNKPSEVIYPPIDVSAYQKEIPKDEPQRVLHKIYDGKKVDEDYYLVVARLSAYKKIDIAVEACNRLQVPLTVVGTGRELKQLREQAWSTVRFVGQISEEELKEHYRSCRALLMPGLEDFGMVMAEAMAFGKPVIAYKGGGALEIVKPGVNGEFFEKESVRSLMDAIRSFEVNWSGGLYQPKEIFETVQRFDKRFFKDKMQKLISRATV